VEKTGCIAISINGTKGNLDLSPDTYDIREIMAILGNAEDLLFPNDKMERPTISYNIEQGSVRHIFKTSVQYIIGFNAVIGQIVQSGNIDFLDLPTAKAIEAIQAVATKKDYTFTISTSVNNTNEVRIDRSTNFSRTESVWADAEFYLYEKLPMREARKGPIFICLQMSLGQSELRRLFHFWKNMMKTCFIRLLASGL
jgi:hypothetical protein